MICPACKELGIVSTIHTNGFMSHDMCVEVFYDEQGTKHIHDPNDSWTKCTCSNNHSFTFVVSSKCRVPGCDYGSDPEYRDIKYNQ